jgi:hypothetical protein
MSTADRTLSWIIHGEALKLARDQVPHELLDRLAQISEGRDDLRAATAGHHRRKLAASPATQIGHELIAAGLLLRAGVLDGDKLVEAVQIGYQRGKGSLLGYDASR